MKKVVIFDLDGVLIDSHELQKKALIYSYRKSIGMGQVPVDAFFKLSGSSLSKIFNTLGLPEEMVRFYQEYSQENINLIKDHGDIMAILKKIKQKGILCALCTGKEKSRTISILERFHIKKYFDVVVCSDEVRNPKPASDSMQMILKKMHVNQCEAIMIGDGINDIYFARNAGIKVVAVSWGEIEVSVLEKFQPDYIATDSNELYEIITSYFEN